MNVPTKETNAQKHTRLAYEEKAKLEEKRVKNNLERDSRNKNRADTSSKSTRDDSSTGVMTTTEEEVNLLREQIVKLKQVEVQYYLNLDKDRDAATNRELALIQARTDAARTNIAMEEARLRSEEARLLSVRADIAATDRLIDLSQAQSLAAQTIATQTATTAQFTADQATAAALALAEQTAKRPTQWKLGCLLYTSPSPRDS